MTHKPQFTLKAILGCTAALSVPLALLAAGFLLLGVAVLYVAAVGSFAYLMEGRKGIATTAKVVGATPLIIAGFALVVLSLYGVLEWGV